MLIFSIFLIEPSAIVTCVHAMKHGIRSSLHWFCSHVAFTNVVEYFQYISVLSHNETELTTQWLESHLVV